MKNSTWKIIAFFAIAICFFIGGYRAGSETGYRNGFKKGADIAEEYARECISELNNEVEDKFDIEAYDAATLINKYDNDDAVGHYLFDKYGELVNAHFALQYFVDNVEYKMMDIYEFSCASDENLSK